MESSILKNVSIIGSGNWGSTIGKIVANNIKELNNFCQQVKMYVYEETVDNRLLTEIINSDHVNIKYLPGIGLPSNLIASPCLESCTRDADILIFVIPHQFLKKTCESMKPFVKSSAVGVSLIKGLDVSEGKGIQLLTDLIRNQLSIPCAVLMGANLACEVSKEMFCEATLACQDKNTGLLLKKIFHSSYFRITHISDEVGCELCGALKNIVAVGAGIVDGLGYGDNTKAAVIRLGFMEMRKFIFQFFGDRDPKESTFLESCGMADLITTCYGGRNKLIGYHLATTNLSVSQLEKELLNGQSAQGPLTADEVNQMLVCHNLHGTYPLFEAIHNICIRVVPSAQFLDCLKNHPEHM